jgi:hypothetical protein
MANSKVTRRLISLLLVFVGLALWQMFGNPQTSIQRLWAWAGFPGSGSVAAQGGTISQEAREQIQSLLAEKRSRTAAQRKLDSQLIYGIRMNRRQSISARVQTLAVPFSTDRDDVEVDISTTGTAPVAKVINDAGGTIINIVERYGAIRARVNFNQLENLAALPEVIFIQPIQEFMTSGQDIDAARPRQQGKSRYTLDPSFPQRAQRVRSTLGKFLATRAAATAPAAAAFIGSRTSEGDVTHKADLARGVYGIDGTGIKIGVLSNGVVSLATSQALGDLGPVTVLPGQTGTGDEGTAMLELIHDLAPGAQLYFATANGGIATFANNILALRTAGCDIIVDDVFYFVETPFQDGQLTPSDRNGGIVVQAVNDVTAAGAMFFSSAGNSGNLNSATSGTWEGDFVDGGAVSGAVGTIEGGVGRVHDFGAGQTFNILTVASTNPIGLYWSDPLGGATNDYDIFRLNSTGTSVLAAGANFQGGTQDPYEQITATGAAANQRLVIVKFSGVARFLHVNTNRGRLSIATTGQTHGHSHALNGFSVAAAPAASPGGPYPGVFNSASPLETFSSDGPRRIFYNADGTAITPGNVLATGGLLRQKPDITAADGTQVTGVGGFGSPFFGTSAAAPHAAAIAGLIKSAGAFTNAQVRTALISTAIDIRAPGVDRDSGAGIVMALEALKFLNVPGNAYLTTGTLTVSEVFGNGNGVIEPGETGAITIPLSNVGVQAATSVLATLSSTTAGITFLQAGPLSYGNIAADASAINPTSYTFKVSSNFPCNSLADFRLTAAYGGGLLPSQLLNFQLKIVGSPTVINETLDPTAPVSGAGYTAAGGTQTNRLNRNGLISSCSAVKATPNLQETPPGGTRRYDRMTLTNPSDSTRCITVRLSSACNAAAGSQLYLVAYNNSGFVPSAIQTNYSADWGVTTLGDQTISFLVAGGASFSLVVHEITAGATNGNPCPYTLTIDGLSCPAPAVCPTITLNPLSLSNGTLGVPYSATVSAAPALPYNFSITGGSLPPGLSLNSLTGQITGTPTTSGNFSFRVNAQADTCSGFRDYNITIACPTTTLSPATLPGGTAGSPYSQTLSVTPAGSYTFSLVQGSLPSGISLNPTTGVISGTTSVVGSFSFKVQATAANGCGTVNTYSLAIACPSINVSPALLPNGQIGTPYSQVISASPPWSYSFSLSSGTLPPGLGIDPLTGQLSGTPTANGTFNFTVSALGIASCVGSRSYSITIQAGACPTITLPSLSGGQVGQLFMKYMTPSPDGTYSFSRSGTLPPGVTFYSSIGLLFGYPTAQGTFTFSITATDLNGCEGSRTYIVPIAP